MSMIEVIKERMYSLGMTQSELARKSGVNKMTISLILSGKTKDPTYTTIASLASGLGWTMAHLVRQAEKSPHAEGKGEKQRNEGGSVA